MDPTWNRLPINFKGIDLSLIFKLEIQFIEPKIKKKKEKEREKEWTNKFMLYNRYNCIFFFRKLLLHSEVLTIVTSHLFAWKMYLTHLFCQKLMKLTNIRDKRSNQNKFTINTHAQE